MSFGCPFLQVLALWGVVCLYGPHHCRMVQVAAWNKPRSWGEVSVVDPPLQFEDREPESGSDSPGVMAEEAA